MTENYYIQDLRQYVGNGIMWWAIDGKGYTSDIRKAERMPKEEAVKLVHDSEKYRAWPCDYIDNHPEFQVHQIDMQRVERKYSIENPIVVKSRKNANARHRYYMKRNGLK